MKQKALLTLSAIFVSLFAVVGVTYASTDANWSPNGIVDEENVTVEKGTTHKGSLYVAGNVVKVEGNVDGSLYCAGQKVTVSGNVSGDVICAAQQLTISGKVGEDLRVAGQTIAVNNTVGGDASIFGQLVTIDSAATIAGDLNGGAQNLTLDGKVSKNLRYGAQLLTLGGTVQGVSDLSVESVDATGGKFVGNVYYESSTKLELEKYTDSEVVYNQYQHSEQMSKSTVAADAAMFLAFAGISMALFAMLIALVAPRFLDRARQFTGQDPLNTVLIGLAAVYATPVVLIMLLVSVVGIPIATFIMFVWIAILMLSGPFFAYLVGSWILGSSRNIVLRMLVGIITVLVLYIIPIVNIFVVMTAGVIGSGMVIRGLTRGYRKPSYVSELASIPVKVKKVTKETTKRK